MFSAVLWPFKSYHSVLWLNNILVVNNVANCGWLGDSLGHREHTHIWFPSILPHCWFIKHFLTHAMLEKQCSGEGVKIKIHEFTMLLLSTKFKPPKLNQYSYHK